MRKNLFIYFFLFIICVTKAQTIYVNIAAVGLGNGTSWADAYTDLQLAISNASSGQIWVAAGTYYPGTTGSNYASFTLKDNVEIYGGFNGTETLLTQRNPISNVTILSGDLDLSGTATVNDAYHVVNTGNAGSTALLDGFTITLGNATGSALDGDGAGLFCAPTITGLLAPRINQCVFTGNFCTGDGAAIYINGYQTGGSNCAPSFTNCTIYGNTSSGYGGGAYIGTYYSGAAASPRFENCLFYNNDGGISGNHFMAVSGGSGEIYAVFTGCTFYGNGSNLEIVYNSNSFPGSVTLNNCIAYNMDLYSDVGFNANYSDISGGYISGVGNISADPLFINPGANDFRLPCYSPCVNTGSLANAAVTTDFDGNPRVSGVEVDMGAFEGTFTFPLVYANATSTNICAGSSVTLTGSGDPVSYYSWSSGVTDGMAFSPFSVDTYTVTGVDAAGCPGTATVTVNVNNLPFISYTASQTTVCDGTPVTLSGMGGVTYFWDNGISDNVAFTPPVGMSMYTVTGVDMNGCANTASAMITVETNAFITAGSDISVCAGTTSVMLSGNDAGADNYTWSTVSANGGTFDTNNSSLTPTYTFMGDDTTGANVAIAFYVHPSVCPDVYDTVIIHIDSLPIVALSADFTVCETDSILLNGTVGGGHAPYTYNWNNGAMTTIATSNYQTYLPLATDSYTLTATDSHGCVGSDNMTVTVDASENISGTAYVGASGLTDGAVYLIKFIPQQQIFDTVSIFPLVAANGAFNFASTPHGNYLIKVVPDTLIYPNLLPTYYGDKFQWDSAAVINHSCSGAFTADVNVISLLGGTGSGAISGFIIEDNGYGTRYNHPPNHVMVPGGPLKGIDVKLGKNPSGGIQARTSSDSTGYYEFTDLPNDSYRIYVDIPGLPMDSFYIVNINTTIDTLINLDYWVDSNSVYPILPTAVGIHGYASTKAELNVYPNPAKNYTSIVFEVHDKPSASIQLLDVAGRVVLNVQLNQLPKGKHEYQLNLTNNNLSSGMYFIKVQSDSQAHMRKLIIE